MAMQGLPGRMRMAKKTMLMAPSSMGTAISSRRTTYWSMELIHFQHLRIVVAVVEGEFPVVGVERRAHPLGVPRPLPGHIADGQTHQIALQALLGFGVDRRSLLRIALHPPLGEEVIDSLVVCEVAALVAG